jgi:hypothetical protein
MHIVPLPGLPPAVVALVTPHYVANALSMQTQSVLHSVSSQAMLAAPGVMHVAPFS